MARVHLAKRTIVPRYNKDLEQSQTGEVKSYYLTAEELEHYRQLPNPKPEFHRPIIPRRQPASGSNGQSSTMG
ncbi:hypothetical protein [Cohnella soli]|uniref:Uncharacterized protein n=1 Tax=Cohnella soli TaxID=425005 RepID=A0ABW0I3S1_9BACL